MTVAAKHDHHHAYHQQEANAKDFFGFWIYIMSDCLLFASLFATYAVLHNNTFGGPSAADLASMPYVLIETMLLLISSFTYGVGMLYVHKREKNIALALIGITFLLGVGFIGMELNEFIHLYHEGNSWMRSGFLSAFFTLVGTHGLHVTIGLIWMLSAMIQVARHGVTAIIKGKLMCLGLFWHFLDVVWIFVFTIVYLMGAVQ